MTPPWDDTFENHLRPHLKLLAPEAPLAPEASLIELGLDSLEMVSLLVDLEAGYDVSFPEEDLNFQTFATPATLWASVDRLRAGAEEPA